MDMLLNQRQYDVTNTMEVYRPSKTRQITAPRSNLGITVRPPFQTLRPRFQNAPESRAHKPNTISLAPYACSYTRPHGPG